MNFFCKINKIKRFNLKNLKNNLKLIVNLKIRLYQTKMPIRLNMMMILIAVILANKILKDLKLILGQIIKARRGRNR